MKQLHDVAVDRNVVLAYDDPTFLLWLDLIVPGVVSDIFNGKALSGVRIKDHGDQVLGIVRKKAGHLVVCLEDLLVQLFGVLIFEWQVSADHCVQDYSAAPDVSSKSQVLLALDHLWCSVARTAASCLEAFSLVVKVAQAKVDNFDGVVVVEQQIFRLQVSVHNAQFVDVLDARDDLLVHFDCLFLLEATVFHDMLEELPTRAVLHDQVQVVVVLNHLVKLDYVWMTNFLEDCNLSVDSVDVALVFDFVLLKDLDGNLVSSNDVRALLHLSEGAFALGFTNDEATNLLALAVLLLFASLFFVLAILVLGGPGVNFIALLIVVCCLRTCWFLVLS